MPRTFNVADVKIVVRFKMFRYSDWIVSGIEYFEGKPLSGRVGDQLKVGDEKKSEETDSTPCSSQPCGENAVCWNSGFEFLNFFGLFLLNNNK